MRQHDELAGLRLLASRLESLQSELREDLGHARDVADALHRLRGATVRCHAGTDDMRRLLERIELLRELAECRIRTLARLRARMRQLRGGHRPH